MKKNNRGMVDPFTLAVVGLVFVVALFVPNPVSSSLGIGVRPNKTVQTENSTQTLVPMKADGETLYHKDGSVAMVSETVYKRRDLDQQQRVSLWEQFRSLPVLYLILSILGAAAVPGFGFMQFLNKRIKKRFDQIMGKHAELTDETKTIIHAVDAAFDSIPKTLAGIQLPGEINRADLADKIQNGMLNVLSTKYDKSTKDLVRELRAK